MSPLTGRSVQSGQQTSKDSGSCGCMYLCMHVHPCLTYNLKKAINLRGAQKGFKGQVEGLEGEGK